MRIAIDTMGSDQGLSATLPAALAAHASIPDCHLILLGDKAEMERMFAQLGRPVPINRFEVRHAPDAVSVNDQPAQTLRTRRESSMWLALELLRDGDADAVVSGGNTGALMAMGRYLIQTLPGISRPAICAPIPADNGHTWMLDLGANVALDADELHQFADMGSALCEVLDGIQAPKVGLLNIGAEAIKGNDQVKAAAPLLEGDKGINYVGFVEGNDIFTGEVDVVVCDGFVGNVALKVCEGTAQLIARQLVQHIQRNWYSKLLGVLLKPLVKSFHYRIDPSRYNGATFLGLRGVVVKSHGAADAEGFEYAIAQAVKAAKQKLPQVIEHHLIHR